MKNDRISLKNAVEFPAWQVVAAIEPNREIDVRMTYAELSEIVKWIESTVEGEKNGQV